MTEEMTDNPEEGTADAPVEEVDASPEAEETEAEQDKPEGEQPEDDAEDEDGDGSDDGEAEAEIVEVEYEGQKYALPPELKDALLRQQDYSRKTAEVAENRKDFEAQQAKFQETVQLQTQTIEDVAEIKSIDARLEQYQQIDWDMFIAQDPVNAMKADREMRALSDARSQAETRLNETHTRTLSEQQDTLAKARETCREVVAKEIPGWSPELDTKLGEYAQSLGYSPEVLKNITNPKDVVTLHKAFMYDQLVAKRKDKPKPQPVKPAMKVKAKQKGAVDPEKMSPESWVKWREAQLSKKQA